MNRRLLPLLLAGLAALLAAADYSLEQGRRIDDFLTRIGARRSGALFLRKATFSQTELNAYLNLFYNRKFAPEVSAIELDLKDDNRIDGSARVLLKGKRYDSVPAFLRNIEVRFAGRFECTNYRMRFLIEELIVNGAHLSAEVLDEAYSAAQGQARIKRSIFDWFSLLPGVKGLSCSRGKVTFLY
jgi:hypothetical protein